MPSTRVLLLTTLKVAIVVWLSVPFCECETPSDAFKPTKCKAENEAESVNPIVMIINQFKRLEKPNSKPEKLGLGYTLVQNFNIKLYFGNNNLTVNGKEKESKHLRYSSNISIVDGKRGAVQKSDDSEEKHHIIRRILNDALTPTGPPQFQSRHLLYAMQNVTQLEEGEVKGGEIVASKNGSDSDDKSHIIKTILDNEPNPFASPVHHARHLLNFQPNDTQLEEGKVDDGELDLKKKTTVSSDWVKVLRDELNRTTVIFKKEHNDSVIDNPRSTDSEKFRKMRNNLIIFYCMVLIIFVVGLFLAFISTKYY